MTACITDPYTSGGGGGGGGFHCRTSTVAASIHCKNGGTRI